MAKNIKKEIEAVTCQ